MKDTEKNKTKIDTIEKDISQLKKSFDVFMNNHFIHLRDKVDRILLVVVVGSVLSILLLLIEILFIK